MKFTLLNLRQQQRSVFIQGQLNHLNLSREIFTLLNRFLFYVYLGLQSRPRRGFHWDEPYALMPIQPVIALNCET